MVNVCNLAGVPVGFSHRNLCVLAEPLYVGWDTAGRFRLPSCLITSFSDVSAVDDGEYHFYRFDLSCSLLETDMTEINCVITLALTSCKLDPADPTRVLIVEVRIIHLGDLKSLTAFEIEFTSLVNNTVGHGQFSFI